MNRTLWSMGEVSLHGIGTSGVPILLPMSPDCPVSYVPGPYHAAAEQPVGADGAGKLERRRSTGCSTDTSVNGDSIEMDHGLRDRLDQMTTAELVEVLQRHDLEEWRPEVFPAIEEILQERGVDVAAA